MNCNYCNKANVTIFNFNFYTDKLDGICLDCFLSYASQYYNWNRKDINRYLKYYEL